MRYNKARAARSDRQVSSSRIFSCLSLRCFHSTRVYASSLSLRGTLCDDFLSFHLTLRKSHCNGLHHRTKRDDPTSWMSSEIITRQGGLVRASTTGELKFSSWAIHLTTKYLKRSKGRFATSEKLRYLNRHLHVIKSKIFYRFFFLILFHFCLYFIFVGGKTAIIFNSLRRFSRQFLFRCILGKFNT